MQGCVDGNRDSLLVFGEFGVVVVLCCPLLVVAAASLSFSIDEEG